MSRVIPMEQGMPKGKLRIEDAETADQHGQETGANEAAVNLALTSPADPAANLDALQGAKSGDEIELTATATIKAINPDGGFEIELADAEFGTGPQREKDFNEEEPAPPPR